MKKPLFVTVKISFVETLESWLTGLGLGLFALGLVGLIIFFRQTQNTFYQGIHIDNIAVGGLTKKEASELISAQASQEVSTINLQVDDIVVSSSSAELAISKDYTRILNDAFEVGRSGFPLSRVATIISLSLQPQNFTSTYGVDDHKVQTLVTQLAQKVNLEGEIPHATLGSSGVSSSITIDKGKIGRAVETEKTIQRVVNTIESSTELDDVISLSAPVASTAAELDQQQLEQALQRTTLFVGKKAVFSHNEVSLTLNDQKLIALLTLPEGIIDDFSSIIEDWQQRVNREPQEPTFEYDTETLVVEAFTPPRDGLTLNNEQAHQKIAFALQEIETAVKNQTEEEPAKETYEYELPVAAKKPLQSLAGTNDLGIVERIGFGDSEYDHSIPTRIHNVSLATERVSNVIIKPGEEFSFNRTIGEISRATGYQPAYVISGGKTILGDGGGVCQVSTTVFRSVLDAGLKVSKRLQHSYRVSYYELNQKPGIDATVYAGDVDFRFVNDTDHHILLHAQAFPDDLYMKVELFGTSDGRQTQIVDHEVWDYRNPPPPVYSDTTDLPPGVVRQVDWAVSGVKAKFTNVIKDKDGNLIREDEYYSNYIPWSAKYIRGV